MAKTANKDQKKVIGLLLAGGLAWVAWAAYEKMDDHFSRLPVYGGGTPQSEVASAEGLSHLAPVLIGDLEDNGRPDRRVRPGPRSSGLNESAFEAPEPPPERSRSEDLIDEEEKEEEQEEETLYERLVRTGPHDFLSRSLRDGHRHRVDAVFPAANTAIIDGVMYDVGDRVRSIRYPVPNLDDLEGDVQHQSPRLNSVSVYGVTLTDEFYSWEQRFSLSIRPVSIPVSGDQEELRRFYEQSFGR